ncbi:MAG TPA: hypothetical protein VJS13_01200 [Pyrinomonadaceae bacterium]|nr:hypothetical protein [Pyrinomonadaceae bacterium]
MSTVEEIVEAIKELSPEKRDEVRRQLDVLSRLNSRECAGAIEESDNPYPMQRVRVRRPPIKVKGKPVSETLVEDRR